ncbi:MAG TPA: hypothetical protein VFR67_29320 [Pilimelia sp.]|nr:hypothetical protein [Pilimelia sp.]
MTAGLLALALVAVVVALIPGDGPPPQQAESEVQPPIVDETGQSVPTSFAPVSPPPRTSSRPAAPSTSATRPRPAQPPRKAPRPSPTASRSRITVPPRSYEAESGINRLRYGARVDGHPAASGGLMVYAIGADNLGTLEFRSIGAPVSGTYSLRIFYQNPDSFADRTAHIAVNGGIGVVQRFSSTGPCCIGTKTIAVRLPAGAGNTITFGNPDTRAPDIDRIQISGPIG